MIKKYSLLFFIFISTCLQATPTILSKDAKISILTVYPRSNAIYAIFGHTAIRIYDLQNQLDAVYNYGTFNSSRPHFIYHFVKGETDYSLTIDEFPEFKYRYMMWNATIKEQILDLSSEAKQNIFDFMNKNALPQNCEYRYDYFFDNCVTRPRDIIEQLAGGKIIYPDVPGSQTFRHLVHGCTEKFPWISFGIDLVLGTGADSIIGLRQEMFLPVKMMDVLNQSTIKIGNETHPLISAEYTVAEQDKNTEYGIPVFTPVCAAILTFLIFLYFTLYGYKKKKSFPFLDFLLFFAAGIAGCIVAFISFISSHPCTFPNLNIVWLHPLHLAAAIFFLINSGQKFKYWYHLINFVVLTILLISFYSLPQFFPVAGVIFLSILWMRSGNQLLMKKSLYADNA